MVPTRGIVEGVQVWACQWSLGSACRVIGFVQLLNSFMKVVFLSIWRKHQVNTAWSNTFVKSCRNEQHFVKKNIHACESLIDSETSEWNEIDETSVNRETSDRTVRSRPAVTSRPLTDDDALITTTAAISKRRHVISFHRTASAATSVTSRPRRANHAARFTVDYGELLAPGHTRSKVEIRDL